jgi:Cd2+/Zn2+-exporting ATPase
MHDHSAIGAVTIHDHDDHTEFPLWRPLVQLWLSILGGALLIAGLVGEHAVGFEAAKVLYWLSLAIGLVYGVRAALNAMLEQRLDIDVLMVVAAIMAASVDHAEEGALLLVLFTFAGALEELAMERTKREIRSLHAIMPDRAIVLRDGEWVDTTPGDVRTGEEIRVRPGDRVPLDAVILEGISSVDEATLTGESVPRNVGKGDPIYAGTINGEAVLRARVTKLASESSVQRILAMVTEAREQREPLQRLIDRVGQPYTIGVLVISLLVFGVWWLGLGRDAGDAAYTAITLLIVASPCALVIATPTATLAAIARGARAGVLFKGGESIDRLSRTGAVCFDKTGTLTKGTPLFRELHTHDDTDVGRLLAIAGELERDSTHPVAKAIHEAALIAAGDGEIAAGVSDIRSVAGRGMVGRWQGREARVGSLAFVGEIIDDETRGWMETVLADVRTNGQLGVAIVCDCGGAGVIALRDELRQGADTLVGELHAVGVRPVRMLTGDDEIVARRVAEELGLDAYDAQLLPEQKVEAVEAMKREPSHGKHRGVAVIGDGVNDAPALAAADVSIAVGSIGSDAALESADIVLLSEDLARVPWALKLARATRSTVTVNITFAATVIGAMGLVVVVGSLFGFRVPMALGVVAHEGGTVAVVLNSIRLLWFPGARPS